MQEATSGSLRRFGSGSRVAIIGAGFSGTMQAINLLSHDGPHAVIIERRAERIGRGVAYSAAHPAHLLNVRAGNMSAFPDRPDHFAQWLERRDAGGPHSFVPRTVYGAYLREMLDTTAQNAGERLQVVQGHAVAIDERPAGLVVTLDDGRHVEADGAVLALGNLPPHVPPGFDGPALGSDLHRTDPWSGDIADGLTDDDSVLLLGTGLTAIDAALLLDARGFRGKIYALSRRGCLPRAHWDKKREPAELLDRPPGDLSQLISFMRARSAQRGWRDAVDDLRPMTQRMWAAAPEAVKARFLRHLRPYWDVHRHRLAPAVAARIAALQAEGRLSFMAGKTLSAAPFENGVRLGWRPRGGDAIATMDVRRIVNCTGPQGDLLRSDDPLLKTLLGRGVIRPDRLRLGLDVDAQSRVIGKDGKARDRLFAVGPMTRGGLWEVVAVPDIRYQTWMLARRLSNAHWVGGEGL